MEYVGGAAFAGSDSYRMKGQVLISIEGSRLRGNDKSLGVDEEIPAFAGIGFIV